MKRANIKSILILTIIAMLFLLPNFVFTSNSIASWEGAKCKLVFYGQYDAGDSPRRNYTHVRIDNQGRTYREGRYDSPRGELNFGVSASTWKFNACNPDPNKNCYEGWELEVNHPGFSPSLKWIPDWYFEDGGQDIIYVNVGNKDAAYSPNWATFDFPECIDCTQQEADADHTCGKNQWIWTNRSKCEWECTCPKNSISWQDKCIGPELGRPDKCQ